MLSFYLYLYALYIISWTQTAPFRSTDWWLYRSLTFDEDNQKSQAVLGYLVLVEDWQSLDHDIHSWLSKMRVFMSEPSFYSLIYHTDPRWWTITHACIVLHIPVHRWRGESNLHEGHTLYEWERPVKASERALGEQQYDRYTKIDQPTPSACVESKRSAAG